MRERIERIQRMEVLLNQSDAALKGLEEAMRAFNGIQENIRELKSYYENGLWREDYEADEAGELPDDLKRGVLSQDALYNLLADYDEMAKRIRDL